MKSRNDQFEGSVRTWELFLSSSGDIHALVCFMGGRSCEAK